MRFLLLIAALALAACASQKPAAPSPAAPPRVDPLANGRAIFMTGRDLQGNRIIASPRPYKTSCVQCHRADGSGGMHLPDGAVSADLRHHALVNEQRHPYTIALLERAISTGMDNEGERLNPIMPRWRMSKTDLRDVATYVSEKLK